VFVDQVKKSPLDLIIARNEPLFSMPVGENSEDWEVELGREGVWERWRTLGQVGGLEGEELKVRFLFGRVIDF
jgi:hypothetical protein